MRALVHVGGGELELADRPVSEVVAGDDVVVRVVATGICGTDRKIVLGKFPARPGVILGHESVGVIHAVGSGVRGVAIGDRVVVNPTLYCGRCERCRSGADNFCRNKKGTEVGVDRDGTFAEYTLLPERFVHRLPDGIGLRSAILIEPLACVLNNVLAAGVSFDDTVVVLGGGPIGVLCGLLCERRGRRAVVVEPDPHRAASAGKLLRHVITATGADPATAIEAAAGGRRPSVVFDTTGVCAERAVQLVDDGGRVVLMGFDDSYTASLSPLHLTNHGVRLIGAGDFRSDAFSMAVGLVAELNLDGIVTHEFPLERYAEAFAVLGAGAASGDGHGNGGATYGAMKVVLRSGAGGSGAGDADDTDANGWPRSGS
ncbi:zinc-dependent alcohol dehydrogenase [Streptomyces sp. H27-D2]|uniref:zinc-dependent alcohol dehydrogenase n=1 Tax=Streptomyces sp. H27-D2 TaxID=3046304 RepID=UPI002DB5B22E|nr:alcohol dehydrogenase catalytic domain-containing protein [Streptomyces sp. H27-D2]MEC4019442.1 alcohol dehydrogenase catalytic domain-containing protein [Streptomyces sp. H27-D2]